METPQPIEFAIYFGSEPVAEEVPTLFSFPTQDLVDALFSGINDADGWMDCTFVEHMGYYVNKHGELAERAGAHAPPKPNERYVIWGEEPEPGTRPERKQFDTPEQAEAYENGASEMAGWLKYFVVPSADFKPLPGFPESIDTLEEPARSALRAAYQADEEHRHFDELLFVRDDGAFVDSEWILGAPIENQALDAATWNARFDAALAQGYAHSIEDAGLDDDDLARWREGVFERSPEAAARAFAEKYDLDPTPAPGRPYGM